MRYRLRATANSHNKRGVAAATSSSQKDEGGAFQADGGGGGGGGGGACNRHIREVSGVRGVRVGVARATHASAPSRSHPFSSRVSHRVLKLNNGHLSLVHGTTQEATRRGGGRRGILQHTTMAQLNMVC
jgi:hypothetical protein